MSDETDNEAEADAPIAEGLDATWWKSTGSSADAADKEKRAIEAKDFQEMRALRYLESGGLDDSGGYVQPTLTRSRMVNWLQMPRGIDWR